MNDPYHLGAAADLTPEPHRLYDSPAWVYLLREFEKHYRHGSDGGSKTIRAHRKKVRETLTTIIEANPEIILRPPATKPVTAHLPRALDLGKDNALERMARALERVSDRLTWEYGYEKVPRALEKKYAYCEIAGPQGPVQSDRLILGFVLFAPNTTYPQHSHHDIEESYVSISGAWSENESAVHAPSSLVLNLPGHEHRITTGRFDPVLLAYAWVGPDARLAAPGLKFSRTTKARRARGI